MSLIFLATGNCYLGKTERDKNNNVIKKIPPHFEHADDGSCVIVGKFNPETMEQIGNVDVFGNYQASIYLNRALKYLNPSRTLDIPNFKAIIISALNNDIDICDYCKDFQCGDCIIKEWKKETQQE